MPSIADGGNDCNDSDPAVHGPAYRFKHVAITRDGVPVTWNAGEAVLDYGLTPELYLDRGGVIEMYSYQGAVYIAVHTTNQSSLYFNRSAPGAPFTSYESFNEQTFVSLYVSGSGQRQQVSIGRRDDGSGSAIYNESASRLLLRSPHRIAALSALDDRSVLVKYADDQTPPQVVTISATATAARVVQDLPDMPNIDASPLSDTALFVGPGMLHYLASRSLPPTTRQTTEPTATATSSTERRHRRPPRRAHPHRGPNSAAGGQEM